MPTRFTAKQLTASASAGEPRSEESFGGDRDAWHAYQAEWFATITLGEVLPAVGDSNRPKRWKAARRQRGKIEAQRENDSDARGDAGISKRLKVSDSWVAANVPALCDLNVALPVMTPGKQHATRRLSARVALPGGEMREYSETVTYSPAPATDEERWKAEQRDDRHRHREQVALEHLAQAPEREEQAVQQQAAAAAAAAAAKLAEEARRGCGSCATHGGRCA